MPKLTIEVDQRAWQRLCEQAELQGLTPEALAQQLLLGELHTPNQRTREQNKDRNQSTLLLTNKPLSASAALPRGSPQRVLATLNLIDRLMPLNTPSPSREEVDAYLEQERASWEIADGD